MNELLNQEVLSNMTQDDLNCLTNKVEIATEELGKIKSKDSILKDRKKEFNDHLINALHEAFPNQDLEREEKVIKSLFNKIIKAQTDLDASDAENKNLVAGYLRKKVEDIVMFIYAYRYLKFNDVNKLFEDYGIKLEFQPVEEHLKYLQGTNFKETLKEFVTECTALKEQQDDIKLNIDENIYKEIPVTLQYNKDNNPSGITKGVFKKFSLLNLLKKINLFKAKRKFENMVNESETRNKADTLAVSIADTLVSNGSETI